MSMRNLFDVPSRRQLRSAIHYHIDFNCAESILKQNPIIVLHAISECPCAGNDFLPTKPDNSREVSGKKSYVTGWPCFHGSRGHRDSRNIHLNKTTLLSTIFVPFFVREGLKKRNKTNASKL